MKPRKETINNRFRTAITGLRTDERGLQTVEWIFLIVGILVIAGIVLAAVGAFVSSQTAQLPG